MSFPLARPWALMAILSVGGCEPSKNKIPAPGAAPDSTGLQAKVDEYAVVRLTADLSRLSDNDHKVVRLLIEAVQPMDSVFWKESVGDRAAALALAKTPAARRFVEINYGPWDRLNDNQPFIEGVGPKPAGAQFYPANLTKEQLDSAASIDKELKGLYSVVVRSPDGKFVARPYHEVFKAEHSAAAAKLREAAALASDAGLANYLELRAKALETDDYQASDLAWLDMKNNPVDVVIGPIETYEDQLIGAKASHEGFVLIKDQEWSQRLQRFAALLPALQSDLPVDPKYKREKPGTDSDLNAYDVVYYAGDANAGAKTIAINLPNDEQVQLAKGTRRLQLKNAMRAKFDKIMVPIAKALIVEDQQKHVTFDAFFGNTMFHEVAHGLGVKKTVSGKETVREALKENASWMEEGKADVVGLYMVNQLFKKGELTQGTIEDHFVTFLAGIFRSVRFGASSAHGRANMIRFNYFKEQGAFQRDSATGRYRVDPVAMAKAVDGLSGLILKLQGDGDYQGTNRLIQEKGTQPTDLKQDLERLKSLGIPRDIVFEQGQEVLFGK